MDTIRSNPPEPQATRKISPTLSLPVRIPSNNSSTENFFRQTSPVIQDRPSPSVQFPRVNLDNGYLTHSQSFVDTSMTVNQSGNAGLIATPEPLITPAVVQQNIVSKPQPKLFYAEPFTRLDSRPTSRSNNVVYPSDQPPPIVSQQYNEMKTVRILPTHPLMPPVDNLVSSSPLDYFSTKSKKWRLTHVTSDGQQTKKLPRITLVKYKLENFSNNFLQEDEGFTKIPGGDDRRSITPPLRSNSIAVPGRRLSVVTGNSTQILKVLESTPLTPVNVAPDVTQFLFPHEVEALSNSLNSLPRIESTASSNLLSKMDMFTQTDKKVSSSTQTSDRSRANSRTSVKSLESLALEKRNGGRRFLHR